MGGWAELGGVESLGWCDCCVAGSILLQEWQTQLIEEATENTWQILAKETKARRNYAIAHSTKILAGISSRLFAYCVGTCYILLKTKSR